MTLPLIVLAVGSLVVGWVGIPHALTGGANINMFERWLEPVIVKVHEPTPAQPHEGHPMPSATGAESTSHSEAAHEPTDPKEYLLMLLSLTIAAGAYIWAGCSTSSVPICQRSGQPSYGLCTRSVSTSGIWTGCSM
jgi:hypothetical protein